MAKKTNDLANATAPRPYSTHSGCSREIQPVSP